MEEFAGKALRKLSISGALAVLILLTILTINSRADLSYLGTWQGQETETDDLQQSYTNTANLGFTQHLTPRVSVSEGLRYTDRWQEGSGKRYTVTPGLETTVVNDFFQFDLSGTVTDENYDNRSNTRRTYWDARTNSTWDKNYVPDFGFYYSEQTLIDDEEPIHILYTEQQTFGSTMDWNLRPVKLYYDFSWANYVDNYKNTETNNMNHLGKFSYSQGFLQNRLHLSLNHQYNATTVETLGTPGITSLVEHFRVISQVQADIDNTPLIGGLATTYPGLNDGLANTAGTLTVAAGTIDLNIGIKVDGQNVDMLYLYTTTDMTTVPGFNTTAYTWRLYQSTDLFGTTWQQIASPAVTYQSDGDNPGHPRFRVDATGLVQGAPQYLKLVLDSTIGAQPLDFHEIEAYVLTTETTNTTDYVNNITDVNLRVQLHQKLSLDLNGTYNDYKIDPGIESKRRTVAGRLNYDVAQHLNASIGASDTWREDEGAPEAVVRNYSWNINTDPIPTLDFSLGGSRNDFYEAGDKKTTSDTYNFDVTADIYPDLESRLESDYTISKDLRVDRETKILNERLSFTARLSPSVTSILIGDYTKNDVSDLNSDSETYKASINNSWRVSDSLSTALNGSSQYQKTEAGASTTTDTIDVSMTLSPSYNTQVDVAYTWRDSETTDESARMNMRWTVTQNLFVNVGGDYNKTPVEDYFRLNGKVTLRFSTL